MADPLDQYDDTFKAAGQEWNVDWRVLKAIAAQESRGDPNAVSKKGAIGLMQIMPDTGTKLGMTNLRDPTQSIYGGAKYMNEALEAEKDNSAAALLYYHGGPKWREKYGPESHAYVPAVAAHYKKYANANTGTATDAKPAPAEATPVAQTQKKQDDDDPFTKALNAPASTEKPAAAPAKADEPDAFTKALGPPQETPPTGPSLSDIITSPEAQSADRPAGSALPSRQDVVNALQPAPNTTYGDLPWTWVAKDDKTGAIRFAMPNALRAPLLELFGGGQEGGPGMTTTVDPTTGEMSTSLSPLGGVLAGGGVNPLRFGGRIGTPGTPVQLPQLTGAIERATPETWRAVAPGEEYVPGRQYRMNQSTGQREILEAGAAQPNPLRGVPEPEAGAPQPQPPPSPAGREAVPGQQTQATGAQVTTAPIPEKTPAQRITDLEKSVTQTAEDRAGPQMRDDTQYVEGIPPRTLAGREFHPRNSGDEKRAIAKDDAFRKEVEDLRRDRNNGMVDKLREDAQDANALDAAHEARQQVSPAELGVFENEQPTSVAALAARIDKLLSGPEGKQRAVRTTLEDVKKSLYDADGNLETLPSRIYGARKNLTDLLKRGAKGVGDVADDVRASKHVLESLLSDFDEAITKGAAGFQEYLKQWSELSRPIDQMEFLQQYQTGSKKITDKDGYLIPTKVQKMLDDILQGHKAKGVNKAKSLTDEQIANIEAVRNELAADSLKDRMAAVKGSDTFQQFMQEAKAPGRIATGLKIAGELGIGIPSAGLGNFVLQRGLSHLEKRAIAKAAAEEAARKRELLSPPNPLQQP